MPFTKEDFAEECVRQALYCGVNPHYMLGVAQLRSGLSDTSPAPGIGPFGIAQADWNANCTDTEFEFNFLPEDIKDWDMQIPVFALMMHRATDALVSASKNMPSALDLYVKQFGVAVTPQLETDFTKALKDTSDLVEPAARKVIDVVVVPPLVIVDPKQQPPDPQAGPIKLTGIPGDRRGYAQKILDAFSIFGQAQQAAALANAWAESGLNPKAHAAIGEDSWGLFQLNRNGGLGTGHNPADLIDPDTNIAIVLTEAKKYAEFTKAPTLDRAVSAFVRDVERPHDIAGEIAKRLKFALTLV